MESRYMESISSSLQRWWRFTIAPSLLILFCPIVAFAICTANVRTGGSLSDLYNAAVSSTNGSNSSSSLVSFLQLIGLDQGGGSPTAWKILCLFVVVQLVCLRCVPGPEKAGVGASGRIPVYRMNGMATFLLTTSGYVVLSVGFEVFPATLLYDYLREVMWVSMIVSFLLCFWLAARGRGKGNTFQPSGNSLLIDFFWGREVHPNVFGFELKQVTNCRFGMMIWPLIVIACLAKQQQVYGYISNSLATAAVLQLAYIAKFFHWEEGYTRTLDMMHDRAGYYICWGCMIWVPCVYSSQVVYLVSNPISLYPLVAAALMIFGLLCIGLNYHADWQKQEVRKTKGKCLIWGKPPEVIRAKYNNENNEECSQILLLSGWWGISRHFHYIPEIGAAICWTLPCQFNNWLPYFYIVYLLVLLIDRTNRDDRRCLEKYKAYWRQYSRKVPYKIIPYMY